ncbi:hypothetical protein CYMTET_53259 [Cymbomonas tetramitiformis]|uniref:Uncharacterized protein n=1 Tax=Cymbomonas tetramitiformis TaxID=36881 RepID=A0AAE0BIP2_9CHLO|nr:hypothetical protein CYMTET_53259 [Cymbomonas tetramitiformis]
MCDTYARQIVRHPRESGVEEEHDGLADRVEAVGEVWTEFENAKDTTAAEAVAKKRLEKEEGEAVRTQAFLGGEFLRRRKGGKKSGRRKSVTASSNANAEVIYIDEDPEVSEEEVVDLTVSLGRFLEREGQTKRQKIELEM